VSVGPQGMAVEGLVDAVKCARRAVVGVLAMRALTFVEG
jgi:hypothetical protein